ncbi:UvrD-helicase domain-containing protein [Trinickia sp. NRRL B-1857]|uniref:UvrD-helicase domain-containing protein n=1 Tax=Trinickia sp. NRRL B-1857 TaxID=3162879 RepID=UPI003D2C41B9
MSNKENEKNLQRLSLASHTTLPTSKRLIAAALGKLLVRLGARHAESFVQGRSVGYGEGRSAGYIAGLTVGHANGFKEGREQGLEDGQHEGWGAGHGAGYEQGLEAGKQVLEIVDRCSRLRAVPGVDDKLFDAWLLPIDEPLKARVRADVCARLPKRKHPTDDQWKMIFSTTPSTCVVAGAGSGKSTTLVLRILLLYYYLGYELSSLTVVTFTNMSRWDFVRKLQDVFALWELDLEFGVAKAIVCTFHSKILTFVRGLPGYEKVQAFEFAKKRDSGGIREQSDDEGDRMPFETRLNSLQQELLNETFTRLYAEDETFQTLIQILYKCSLVAPPLENDDEVQKKLAVIKKASKNDTAVMDAVETAWRAAGKWPIAGITESREVIVVQGQKFHVHGRVAALDMPVILMPDKVPGSDFVRPGGSYRLGQELGVKQTIFRVCCDEQIVWLNEPDATDGLLKWLADGASAPPGFEYQVAGEIKREPLLQCFFSAAAFIENLGLDVPQTIREMAFTSSDPDRFFFQALAIFWPAFEAHLSQQKPKIMTFNRMFALFGEQSPRNLRCVTDSMLRTMSHLMVDEFQDISPQIVSWVRAVLTEIRRRGPALHEGRTAPHSSLLCVGDDWQSIYSWRGSSPKYFMEFEDRFKSPATTQIMLRENFRSHQHVIDAAEHIVRSAPAIPGKRARAAGPAAKDPIPIVVRDRDDGALAASAHEFYARGLSVMVLFRRGTDGDELKKVLADLMRLDCKLPEEQRRFKLLSYHRSKGLEADAVLLVGDCIHMTDSPYKNQAYLIARLGDKNDIAPFDTAQRHEILRLAYVAITRAARYCLWYIAPTGAQGRARASTNVPVDKPYFRDERER